MSPIDDNQGLTLELTEAFIHWRERLRDRRAKVAVNARLLALEQGHWGDVKPVDEGVSELRIHSGPGYRLYATRRDAAWVILLCGGDKDDQRRDIELAKAIARELKDGD